MIAGIKKFWIEVFFSVRFFSINPCCMSTWHPLHQVSNSIAWLSVSQIFVHWSVNKWLFSVVWVMASLQTASVPRLNFGSFSSMSFYDFTALESKYLCQHRALSNISGLGVFKFQCFFGVKSCCMASPVHFWGQWFQTMILSLPQICVHWSVCKSLKLYGLLQE